MNPVDLAEVKRLQQEAEAHYLLVKREIITKIKDMEESRQIEVHIKRERGWVKYHTSARNLHANLKQKPMRWFGLNLKSIEVRKKDLVS